MQKTEIAALLVRAADLLDNEAVTYALGLDYDHLDSQVKQVEVTRTDLKGVSYTILEEVPRTESDMDADIEAHNAYTDQLRAAAESLTKEI